MASGQCWYGSLKPHYFVLVDSSGNRVTGHTFVTADIYLMDTGQGGGNASIASEITALGLGVYKWTPTSAAQTQVETVVIAITDSAGSSFIDNTLTLHTGGNASSYFDAGT